MSSGSERPRPSGLIRQSGKIVGAVCIDETDDAFVDQFNAYYGGSMMRACKESIETCEPPPERFRLPVWSRDLWYLPEAASPPVSPSTAW